MLLSATAYIDRALECDYLAKKATRPSEQARQANMAAFYRYMADQVAKLEPDVAVGAPPPLSGGLTRGAFHNS